MERIEHLLPRLEIRQAWDQSKRDGWPRRMLDTSGAPTSFGFVAKTPCMEGLRRTVEWYLGQVKRVSA